MTIQVSIFNIKTKRRSERVQFEDGDVNGILELQAAKQVRTINNSDVIILTEYV